MKGGKRKTKAGEAMRTASIARLVELTGDALPTEIRLFVPGWNESENGRYLFDEKAAKAVMAAYKAHGVDRMFDLEHLSLEDPETSANFDPDARAWCHLELRDNGELWAVDIVWTEDGARRLTEKTQRYVSPAFRYDKEGRITKVINIALTALPATHGTPELVAAARVATRDLRKLSDGPSLNDLQRAICEALIERFGDTDCGGPWVCDVYDASAVYEYDGKLWEVPYTFDGSAATLGMPVEVKRTYAPIAAPSPSPTKTNRTAKLSAGASMDPKQIQETIDAIKNGDAAAALAILEKLLVSAAGGTPAPAEQPPADPAADAAMQRIARLTGKATPSENADEFERLHKLAASWKEHEDKIAAEKLALEAGEYDAWTAAFVVNKIETPATAWADPLHATDPSKRKPAKHIAAMSLAELRARGAQFGIKLSAPAARPPTPRGAGGEHEQGSKDFPTSHGVVTLSARELAMCDEMKVAPADYAAKKATQKKS